MTLCVVIAGILAAPTVRVAVLPVQADVDLLDIGSVAVASASR